MSAWPRWIPAVFRTQGPLERGWALFASAWIALVAAWQWPAFELGPGLLTTGVLAVLYFPFVALALGGFLTLVGPELDHAVESKNIARIGRLDHLRFFAAALVVLYHYFGKVVAVDSHSRNIVSNIMIQGSSGVDIFFVLSGFIFGLISYQKKIRYGDFIWSRVVRIYPLYIVAVLLVLGAYAQKFLPLDSVLLLFPIFIVGYLFALPGFGQLWTVGLEFQFYLIFPFLAAFLLRNGYRYLLALLILAIGARACYYMEMGAVKNLAYGSLPGRIDQFLLGIGAAWLYVRQRNFFSHPLHLLAAAILGGAALQWLVAWDSLGAGANSPLWIIWPTIAGAIWAYLTLSYVSCRITLPAFLDQSLAKLGALSFSIYIMHDFAVVWSLKHAAALSITGRPDRDAALTGVFICLPLATGMAWCTYHLIEKQFFIFRRKYVEAAGIPPG
jgi:peptidoglycan/LPS O-acetylase OafA/YrhL